MTNSLLQPFATAHIRERYQKKHYRQNNKDQIQHCCFSSISHSWVASTFHPPTPYCNQSPNGLDQTERPGSLKESVERRESTAGRKRQDKPTTAVFQGVAHQHYRDREKAKCRQPVHCKEPESPTIKTVSLCPDNVYSEGEQIVFNQAVFLYWQQDTERFSLIRFCVFLVCCR
jgi:hypothetical protein